MKKILMISYHFPPEEGSCSDKNVKILQVLSEAGYHVDVLTVGENLDGETFLNQNVFRVKGGIFHKGKNICVNDCKKEINTESQSKLKASLKKFVQKNIVPDPVIDWYPNVRKWLKKNESRISDYSLVFSISSPYSVHLISYYIYKKYKIPYICSYGDPWVYEPSRKRGKIRYALEFQIEKRIVRNAAAINLITEYNKKAYCKMYNLDQEKVVTFNIGYRQGTMQNTNRQKGDFPRLIYGGSLNPVHRNIVPFLDAMSRDSFVKVDIYNGDFPSLAGMVDERGLKDCVRVHDLISAKEFNAELYKSDMLLLFGNRTVFQVPGKLFEYISTGTHIVYIKNNDDPNDASEAILSHYGNTTIVANKSDEILKALAEIRNKHQTGLLNAQTNADSYEFHKTMESIVKQVERFVN